MLKGFTKINITAEEPDINMYHFDGSFTIKSHNETVNQVDLNLINFVPRGCVVCNCKMYAVVVYTGVDTKIILN